ncbi:MAG: hypothetical protein Fur0020_13750 [Thermodesulfovibrionia bacterium]
MRVVIFSHYGIGGSLKYLQGVADAFTKIDYPVEFYLPYEAKGKIPLLLNSRFILKEPSISNMSSRIRYLKFLHHLLKYLYNNLIFNPPSDCRVVHLLFPFYMTDLILIKRLHRRGISVIITLHEVLAHRGFLGNRIDRLLISNLCRNADLILAHTKGLKSEMETLLSIKGDKIRVVPHGFFELPRSRKKREVIGEMYNLPPDKKILLFFGEIRENKGLDDLLKAVSRLSNDYYLLIAGTVTGSKEPPLDYYKDLMRRLAIEDRVSWINRFINEEEIPDIFEVSDAVILPYKRSFHAQSGVLNLAVGFERPCIVTDVGGIGEVVKRHNIGVVVKPDDPECIKNGIVSVFAHREGFDFGGYKQENSWVSWVEKMIKIYDELLGRYQI